jgi:hypothetical protein
MAGGAYVISFFKDYVLHERLSLSCIYFVKLWYASSTVIRKFRERKDVYFI